MWRKLGKEGKETLWLRGVISPNTSLKFNRRGPIFYFISIYSSLILSYSFVTCLVVQVRCRFTLYVLCRASHTSVCTYLCKCPFVIVSTA